MDIDLRINTTDLKESEKAELCFKLVEEGKYAVRTTTQGYMRLGEILDILLGKGSLWKHYASHIQTKNEFIKDAFNFSVGMASHIMRTTKVFREHIGERTIPFYRLLEAKPIATDENIEDILDKAESLSHADWENEVKIMKGGMDNNDCPHEDTETWERCKNPRCQKWLRKIS